MLLKNTILAFLLMLISASCFAQNLEAQLNLVGIKGLHTTERMGDELYFNVTEFRRDHVVKHYSIPELPGVWSSQALEGLPKLKLWQKEIAESERLELIITLVEHDSPPWDREDILGTVKVLLKNEKGKLIIKWLETKSSEAYGKEKEQSSPVGHFLFKGEAGLYQVAFQIITL